MAAGAGQNKTKKSKRHRDHLVAASSAIDFLKQHGALMRITKGSLA